MSSNEGSFFMHVMFRFGMQYNSVHRAMWWLWGDGQRGKAHVGKPLGAGFQILFTLLLVLVLVNRGGAAEDTHPAAEAPSIVEGHAAETDSHGVGNAHGATENLGHGDMGHGDMGHGDAGPNLENPAEFRGDMAIYTFVVFILLLAILGKIAWPAITAALEERERNIEENIAAATAKHEEARRLLAEHEAKLAEASGEVRELMDEARRDAEHAKAQIVEEAKQAASAERDRAIREVDMATEAAMQRLAETSANLAVDLASKVVRTNVTKDQQSQLVRDALAQLAQSSPSDN
jgi:F-type H+-transporting ATPase subunit b